MRENVGFRRFSAGILRDLVRIKGLPGGSSYAVFRGFAPFLKAVPREVLPSCIGLQLDAGSAAFVRTNPDRCNEGAPGAACFPRRRHSAVPFVKNLFRVHLSDMICRERIRLHGKQTRSAGGRETDGQGKRARAGRG